ncbi:MAG: hypothetical protein VB055_07230 [Oscillospiraceae bacterium]|nr:hypothetical protein [Oscillospiraceae bacterium]
MRQKLTAVLMMLCLLLTSCGAAENSMKDALAFRSVLQEHGGCSFTAAVTTEVEDRGYCFTLQAEYRTDAPTRITVTEPETLRGISAELTAADAVIAFDGVELDFGTLDSRLSSPLYCPLVFGSCWDQEYIDCAGADGDSYRVTYRMGYDDEELILETWFTEGVPSRCEIYGGETLLLSADVESFIFLP